jgi:two-component system, NarL family, nitrate/nitrite response regulator NarL
MPLSARELAILRHLMRGSTNKQIASDLGITEAGVKAHLTRLFRKLDVENRSQARVWARDNGIDAC